MNEEIKRLIELVDKQINEKYQALSELDKWIGICRKLIAQNEEQQCVINELKEYNKDVSKSGHSEIEVPSATIKNVDAFYKYLPLRNDENCVKIRNSTGFSAIVLKEVFGENEHFGVSTLIELKDNIIVYGGINKDGVETLVFFERK